MTVQTLKTSVDAKMPNTLVVQDYVDYVNDIEASVYMDTVKEFASEYIPLVAGQHQYDFPTGTTILDIENVFLNGTELPKRDLRQKNVKGYYKEENKLALYPVPSVSDAISEPSLEVVYRVKPTGKTAAGIATETLLLPDAFANMYRYYIFAQICLLREQYDKANVWMEYYNSRMVEFKIWYENNRPKQHIPYKRW